MRLDTLWGNLDLYDLCETLLPDFVLAFTFFTSLCYAVLGKHFGRQRPAIGMAAAIGFALSIGLVWWERANDLSVRDLGPVAIGFAVILLALVMYQSIHQVGGSWAGAALALGASILVAKLLGLSVPIAPQVIQVVTVTALIVGIIALVSYTRSHAPARQSMPMPIHLPEVRHDMTDLYRGRQLSNRLAKGLKRLRRRAATTLPDRPAEAPEVLLQFRRMLPAEGYLTEKMAQLRAKAHRIRNGHIARLDETRNVFAKLSGSVKKKAAAELAAGYQQIIGVDTRLERLDRAVAENERRIIELTKRAEQYAARYDYRQMADCSQAAEKLQHHNSRLLKLIERSEAKLSAVAEKVAKETKEADKE
jgi:endonuclease III